LHQKSIKIEKPLENLLDKNLMKSTILLLTIWFCFPGMSRIVAQAEPVLTLVTTIDPKLATSILFEPEGNIELAYWKDNFVQVTINIESNGFSRQQVKALIPSGLFKIEQYQEPNQLRLAMPGLDKDVTIKGKKVVENVSFVIILPAPNLGWRPLDH
jgi:hypothetical protein